MPLAVVGNAKINDQENLFTGILGIQNYQSKMQIQAYYIYHSIVIITGMVQ